jgi:hypothetical protein
VGAENARSRSGVAAAGIFLVCCLFYAALAQWAGRTKSPTMAYYPELASAFTQGRLDLGTPEVIRDLTFHEGVYYLAFPPLPALLMIPEANAQGSAGVNTITYSIVLAAAAVSFVFLFLEELRRLGWTRLSFSDDLWLTALVGFGSVLVYMSIAGTVWLVQQVTGVAFVALAFWLAARVRHPLPSGGALALALLARPSLFLLWPGLLAISAQKARTEAGETSVSPAGGGFGATSRLARSALVGLVPAALAALALLAYNQARFGSPFEFGYAGMAVSPDLAEEFETYGQFDIHFLPRNLRAMLFGLPVWNDECGAPAPDPQGMSLLLTMPALVFLARTPAALWTAGSWLGIGLSLIPLALYHNTGWYQFGYRFSLDFLVPVVGLLAAAAGPRLSPLFRASILAGIAVNLWGAAWFFEQWCAG